MCLLYSGLVSSLSFEDSGSSNKNKSSPEESSTSSSSSGMNSAASISVEDALTKLGLSEDDETTSSRSLPHSSEPANPAKKQPTKQNAAPLHSRIYRKKLRSFQRHLLFIYS